MKSVRLGRSEAVVPAIGFGTWGHAGEATAGDVPVGWSGHDDRQATAALLAACRSGLNHLDTADVYGDGRAERLIGGIWDRVPRGSVFLASKVGWAAGAYGHAYDPRQIRHQLEASLRNLATDWIDLYYFHRCEFGPDDRYLDDAVDTFRRAREAGQIRSIGLSDWDARRIARYAGRVDPDVVQLHHTVLDDDYAASGLAAWVAANDRAAAFFSPLLHGLLLGLWQQPPRLGPGDHRRSMPAFRDAHLLAHLRRCRAAVGERFASHPQPVLHALTGALLTGAPGACVLLGLRRPEHVAAALGIGETLSEADAAWVRELYRQVPDGAGPLMSHWRANHD
jgi:aryl-alcohol dehydrogenase-like predicted oxidoreductase